MDPQSPSAWMQEFHDCVCLFILQRSLLWLVKYRPGNGQMNISGKRIHYVYSDNLVNEIDVFPLKKIASK